MKPVVLDTSVILSGFLSTRGPSGALVAAFFTNRIRLAYTDAMLAEYMEVLERSKFSPVVTPEDRTALMLKLHTAGIRIRPAEVPPAKWPDPDDLPFVAATLATEEKILVTLNPRDFIPASALGVHILSPATARLRLL